MWLTDPMGGMLSMVPTTGTRRRKLMATGKNPLKKSLKVNLLDKANYTGLSLSRSNNS